MKSMYIRLALISLLFSSVAFADQPLLFTAKQKSTGKYFQRVDTGLKSPDAFARSVASQFGVPLSEVEVETLATWTEDEITSLKKSINESPSTIMAPIPAPTPKEIKKKAAQDKIKAKLGLTDSDLADLKTALGD